MYTPTRVLRSLEWGPGLRCIQFIILSKGSRFCSGHVVADFYRAKTKSSSIVVEWLHGVLTR